MTYSRINPAWDRMHRTRAKQTVAVAVAYEVVSDGVTVWVNDDKGYCLGRFGRAGIDVHQPPSKQSKSECLFCTHAFTSSKDFDLFAEKMREHHGVEIHPDHRPTRFARKP